MTKNRFLYDSMLREAARESSIAAADRSPPPPPRDSAWNATDRERRPPPTWEKQIVQMGLRNRGCSAVLLVLSVIARSKGSVWTAAGTLRSGTTSQES